MVQFIPENSHTLYLKIPEGQPFFENKALDDVLYQENIVAYYSIIVIGEDGQGVSINTLYSPLFNIL